MVSFGNQIASLSFTAAETKGKSRCYDQKLGDSNAVPFTPENFSCMIPSPDGKHILTFSDGSFYQASTTEGIEKPVAALKSTYRPLRWIDDYRMVVIQNRNPFTLDLLDIESGRSRAIPVKIPLDTEAVFTARINADANSLAYTGYRLNSDLYFLRGLKQ